MPIRIKLVAFIILVGAVLGAAVWHELATAFRVERKVKLFVPATGYLLGIAEVNSGLARQTKEALDYFVTGDPQDREEFKRLTKAVEKGFKLWIESAKQQQQLGVEGETEDLDAGQRVKEAYYRWVEQIVASFEQLDKGDLAAALMRYEGISASLLERQIFVPLDARMEDGFNEVEEAYHELLMAMGGRLWCEGDHSEVLVSTHSAINNVIAGSRVNSAIGRQFAALSAYLLTGKQRNFERYEEMKIEVRGALNDWFLAAYEHSKNNDMQHSDSASRVSEVVAALEELLASEEDAIFYRQSGYGREALRMIVAGPIESPIGNHLPLMVFSTLESGGQELIALASNGSKQGIVLIGLSFSGVLLATFLMGRKILISLETLQDGMDAVGRGDLQQRIVLHGNDEFSRLAEHFNLMSSQLFNSQREVELLNAELEQRVMERTKQLALANKELEAYDAAVSHDLRTPLTSVLGYSELLLEQPQIEDEELRQSLREIRLAGERMEALINSLLDLSRIDSIELQREELDLASIAREIMDRFKRHSPERNVRISIEPELVVEADYNLMTIVLQNLLGNAWKYTSDCDLTENEFGSSYKDAVRHFYVRDNGAGFDMARADQLFSPFRRLHDDDEFQGTGVGLATVQRILNCHGGEVWGEGEVGAGATFYFTL